MRRIRRIVSTLVIVGAPLLVQQCVFICVFGQINGQFFVPVCNFVQPG